MLFILLMIQEVVPKSPAAQSGLIATEDYILGTAEQVFFDSDDFYEEVADSLDQTLQVYVYNIESDEVRQCQITPTRSWGGPGILGTLLLKSLFLFSLQNYFIYFALLY